jgi:hypothetical protein
MNIPTVGVGAVEYRRLVTTTSEAFAGEATSNSTPPAEFGATNAETTMSSKARDSRGDSEKVVCADDGQAPMKHRYVAVIWALDAYDVLNTRTSEKNGDAPTIDATAGTVIREDCAESGAHAAAPRSNRSALRGFIRRRSH